MQLMENKIELDGQRRIEELEDECRYLQKKIARLQGQLLHQKEIDAINRRLLQQANVKIQHYHEQGRLEDRSKSDFLANMSHEIRTPLNIILGMANLLAETELDLTQSQYLSSLRLTGRQLMEILNNVLEFSRIEAGKIAVEPEPFSLQKIIDQLEASALPLCLQKKLDFHVERDPSLVMERVGDSLKIFQIVLNLINNAVKFTQKGSITLKISEELSGEPNLIFSVVDTGIGIAEDQQEIIFERFVQAGTSQVQQYGGAGLGLSISQKLTRAMGGRLTVRSTLGKGSIFSCFLSLPPVATSARKELRVDVSLVPPKDFPKMKILAVDDTRENIDVFKAYLKDYPVELDTAENGFVALNAIEKKSYDIILMDIRMPVMDGITATKKIRKNEERKGGHPQVVLAVTAHAFQEQKKNFIQAGFDGVLTKPFFKRELLQTIYTLKNSSKKDQSDAVMGNKALGYWFENEHPDEIPETLKELIPDVLQTIDSDLHTMKLALEKKDYELLYSTSHSLRGMSGMFGFTKLATLVADLSKSVKTGNLVVAEEIFVVLDVYLTRLGERRVTVFESS